ncbi:MAG TPA: TolC family protein [Niabella sp.]|nr:TolC family protein [Niabella sp.]
MKIYKIAFGLLFLLLATTTFSQQVHHFSLKEALDYAQKNNVQVKNALLDVKLQQQVNREVTGTAYPQLSASSQLTYNAALPTSLVPSEFFGGKPGEYARLKFGVNWSSTAGFALNQLLFDGQVFTGLQARQTLIDFKNKNVEVTEEQIRTNVAKIYYQLVVSNTQITLLDTNIALIKKLNHDTKIMYENGFAEKLDMDKQEVQLANLNSSRTTVINQIDNGYLGLKVLMGMPLTDSLVLTDNLSDDMIREGILEASNFDYNQRKDYQFAKLGVKLNEYDIQRYKYSKIPQLSLTGYYNEMAQSNKLDLYSGHAYWSPVSAFTLNLRVPLFTGFAANARITQAKIKLEETHNNIEAMKLNIDREIQTSINNFKSAITNLDYQKNNMNLAQNVYNQTKKKYEIGTGSQTEINLARADMEAAQTNYYNALYNAVIAKVDFMKATGKL